MLRPMRILLLPLLILLSFFGNGQQQIGQWSEHLPYNRGKMLADAGAKIYCATEDALFAYIKDDASIERFTRLNGLHDFGISSVAYDNSNQVLIIGYSNSNIDMLYDDGSVFNISFIKDKNITGNRSINHIYIKNNLAYLACGFGIVVIDIQRQEIKDTYYIGPSGSSMNVLDIADDGNYIYAATDSGVFSASFSSPNLADFNNWTRTLDDVNNAGDYNFIFYFNGKIYVNYAQPAAGISTNDELWMYDGTWSIASIPSLPSAPRRYSMRAVNNELIVTTEDWTKIFDTSWQVISSADNSTYNFPVMRDGYKDAAGNLWIADHRQGLIKISAGNVNVITPSGPTSPYAADVQVSNNQVWVAHGPKSTSWNPQEYPVDGFSYYKDGEWKSFNSYNLPALSQHAFQANMSIAIVPGESNHVRVGSVVHGMLDFNNDQVTAFYNETNSTLIPAIGNITQTIVHGMTHDDNGNLWVVNSGVPNVITALKKDGTWSAFNLTGAVNGAPFGGYIAVDQSNYKWVNLFGGSGSTTEGLAVLDDNGTLDNQADDRKVYIKTDVYPRCLAVDLDGQLWVGTDEGPQVIYSPASAFENGASLQKILIFQDNTYQYLLETEIITFIAVDGANRKWIGTQSSGIYLVSADGQNEIHHFTTYNSPIFSNNITCIGINNDNGEVFIGTDKGLISYQSDAIEGTETCNDVTVYPNPVRPQYNGPIAIKGVMNNALIKITDISGSVVFQGTALGGQAIWNGKNFQGEKAHTGIYLVFASDEAGENACVSKLMFMR
jgi:ligand-binding sensor domain-containing protein